MVLELSLILCCGLVWRIDHIGEPYAVISTNGAANSLRTMAVWQSVMTVCVEACHGFGQ